MKNLVLFASGTGSNAENVIRHFKNSPVAQVVAVFTNNRDAGVIERANSNDVPVVLFTKEALSDGTVNAMLTQFDPTLIVLAGFLLKFPIDIVRSYPNKIINIHPALLPKYGGKGMYGLHVHRAILQNRDAETGISIHFVDEHYDNGDLIFQARISVADCISAEEIASKVHSLEHKHFPKVIERLLL